MPRTCLPCNTVSGVEQIARLCRLSRRTWNSAPPDVKSLWLIAALVLHAKDMFALQYCKRSRTNCTVVQAEPSNLELGTPRCEVVMVDSCSCSPCQGHVCPAIL